eukprot:2743332-Rhodomonas_salina.1
MQRMPAATRSDGAMLCCRVLSHAMRSDAMLRSGMLSGAILTHGMPKHAVLRRATPRCGILRDGGASDSASSLRGTPRENPIT